MGERSNSQNGGERYSKALCNCNTEITDEWNWLHSSQFWQCKFLCYVLKMCTSRNIYCSSVQVLHKGKCILLLLHFFNTNDTVSAVMVVVYSWVCHCQPKNLVLVALMFYAPFTYTVDILLFLLMFVYCTC